MKFCSDAQRKAVMSNFSRDKNVSRGGRFEQKIRSRLDNSNSIVTVRSSGSRSLWDVVSITPDKVRLIQAKSSGYLTPKEREDMLSDIKRMPDNVQAEFEYYTSPRVRTNRTIKKAGETDWDKVEERLEYFSKVRGYRKADHDEQNRFALYVEDLGIDKDGDEHLRLKSDEYPEVDVVFWPTGMSSDKALEYASVVPDEDLLGLKRMDIYTASKFRKDYPGRTETSFYIPELNTKKFETPAAVINTKGGKKQAIHDVLHEIGHHVDTEHTKDFLRKKDRFLANLILDMPAESYVKEVSPGHVMGRTTDWSDERIEYEKELARQKGVTFDEAMRYAGVSDEI